jgi:KEOPS complex subunit Pcc1
VTSKKSTSPEGGHEATLTFPYETESRAERVAESTRLESSRIPGERTTATVERADATVTVTVSAADLPALRAGLFTWCSLVETAEETLLQLE